MTGIGTSLGFGKSKSKTKEQSETKLFSDKLLKALDESALNNLSTYDALVAGGGQNPQTQDALNKLGTIMNDENAIIDVDAIMAAAKQQSDTELGQSYQELARSVGATDNSLVQGFYNEASNRAAINLAAKRAELEAANADKRTTNASNAATTILETMQNQDKLSLTALNSLLELLKGADTRGTGTSSTKGSNMSFGLQGALGGLK